jgi:hypothetical protein
MQLNDPSDARKYTRWLLTEPLRRQMNDVLGHGLAMEGLVICNCSLRSRMQSSRSRLPLVGDAFG